MYGKLFASMYEGTLYGHWEAIVTFQQMIVLADEDGIIDITPPAIAAKTSIPLEIIEKGIEVLSQEDKYSRSTAENGRRIVLLDESRPWGWQIVNYRYYRDLASREDKKRKDRERIRAKRGEASGYDGPITGEECSYCGAPATGVDHIIPHSMGGPDTNENTTPACHRCNASKQYRPLLEFLNDSTTEIDIERVLLNQKLNRFVAYDRGLSRFVANVAHTDTDTNTKTDTGQGDSSSPLCASRFGDYWAIVPQKVKRKEAEKVWKSKKLDAIAEQIIADVKNRLAYDDRWRRGYIPDPPTYLRQERWTDELTKSSPPGHDGERVNYLG